MFPGCWNFLNKGLTTVDTRRLNERVNVKVPFSYDVSHVKPIFALSLWSTAHFVYKHVHMVIHKTFIQSNVTFTVAATV